MNTLALAHKTRLADLGLSGYGRVRADWQPALPVAMRASELTGAGSKCVRIPVSRVEGTVVPMTAFGSTDHGTFPGIPAWSPPI